MQMYALYLRYMKKSFVAGAMLMAKVCLLMQASRDRPTNNYICKKYNDTDVVTVLSAHDANAPRQVTG